MNVVEGHFESIMRFEIRCHNDDVRAFLQKSLLNQYRLAKWISDDPEFEIHIVDEILARLGGM